MTLDDLLKQDSEWMKGTGPKSDVVMSSRTRLARNIDKIPFSHWADDNELEEVLEMAKEAARSANFLKGSLFLSMKDLSDVDRLFLVERHLMSPEHTKDVEYKALILDPKEIVSVMVNEEDHLRIQVMQSGLNLREAWTIIDEIDTDLSKKLPFAYSTKLGYMTACPTNVGTGLRGSVMLHLPALVFSGQIERVLQATTKLGLNIRGFYGEGTEASGNLFQVSNQVSLGRTEEEMIENIERIINQIITREESARQSMMTRSKDALVDRVWRAYGTLKSAHIITSKETAALLSAIRLGVDLGVVKDLNRKMVNELFISTQPAHLQKLSGKVLTPEERDIKRADIVRERLK
jgi:protein arginine kinase